MLDRTRQLLHCTHPDALPADVHRVATHVIQNGFRGIVVAPIYVARVSALFCNDANREVDLFATVNVPAGTSKPTIKAIEATSCLKDGATGVIIAAHLPHVIRGDIDAARAEYLEIARAARAVRRDAKLIAAIDLASLRIRTEAQHENFSDRLAIACRAIREGAFDGVAALQPTISPHDVRDLKMAAESLVVFIGGPVDADVLSLIDREIVEMD